MTGIHLAQALRDARSRGVDRLDAQLMLCAIVKQSRTWLQAHDDEPLTTDQTEQWQRWLDRRASGEPLAYVLGQKEFHGLMLQVSADVLVPRADTETLVDWALELLSRVSIESNPKVVDLGCGSGAIALAVKQGCASARVKAVDASSAALRIAATNAARLGLDIEFLSSNWWSALAGETFDLALSNPPYIAEDDPHLEALGHEPRMALTSGVDGLDDLRHVIANASAHLSPGAWLLLEHGHTQGTAVRTLLAQHGFQDPQTRRDLGGNERCTGGRWME